MEGNKKESVFKKIENNILLQVVFFVVSMAVIVGAYVVVQNQIKKMFEIVDDDFSWVYQIDSITENEGEVVLEGWAFDLDVNSEKGNVEIVLLDIDTNKRYYPEMSFEERTDVNDYFLCEYDYTDSGFKAEIKAKKLDLDEGIYEVILRPAESRKAYATGIYYADGEMLFTNPKEFVPLRTEGTDLDKIVKEGVLRVYRPDVGMYVYQYEGTLYWIAEPWYEFINGDAYIQFQMNTTQVENLPQDRLDNGWYWSNLGFWFQKNKLVEGNLGQYQVVLCSLPKEYSLTKIWTGYHSDNFPVGYVDEKNRSGWLWQSDFRPWFKFGEK